MSIHRLLALAGLALALLPLGAQGVSLLPQERTGVAPSRGWTPPRQSSAVRVITVADNQIEARAGFELAFPRKAYRLSVPPGGMLTITLDHPRRGQLRGSLQARGVQVQEGRWRWTNRGGRPQAVLFVVTDPMEVSGGSDPYIVGFDRSWTRRP